MQKTRSEIMAETFAAYENPENRGLSPMGQCQYLTVDGKMCAVGRCMINPGNKDYVNKYNHDLNHTNTFTIAFEDIENRCQHLKEEYRGHSVEFWTDLQRWHDCEDNFQDNEISQRGLNDIEKLKSKWSE